MSYIWTITRLTFQEAWRRWMVLIALLLGALFVFFYGLGFKLIYDDAVERVRSDRRCGSSGPRCSRGRTTARPTLS